jgi:2-polyprenyl-3-methyl-5-hydroxy-6-metoxy-1,4-benzoquinol methylase
MKNLIKSIFRSLNFILIKSKDPKEIKELKKTFIHNDRSFVYGLRKFLVDSLYCHASPGVIETIILELENIKNNRVLKENKLLNIGGGTGQVSEIYKNTGFEVYNLDIDIKLVDEKNIAFDLNQNTPIPFEKASFDVVVCEEIIEHIENPWKMFREAKRLMKDDGILIITTPNILSLQSKIRFFLTGYFKWFTPECFDYHINPIPMWEIDLIARKNDFNIYHTKGSGDYFFNKENKKIKSIIRNNESLIFFLKKNN